MTTHASDKNYVSLAFWLFSMLIMAFPLVNILMAFYWAFSGDNQSRQNYFKAMILVWMIILSFAAMLFIMGFRLSHVKGDTTRGTEAAVQMRTDNIL
jgi:Na+/melibiose symporter-like transporter